jgi:hypothetical protein
LLQKPELFIGKFGPLNFCSPIGGPNPRWEDDVLGDIKSINISNWKKVAQNRDS